MCLNIVLWVLERESRGLNLNKNSNYFKLIEPLWLAKYEFMTLDSNFSAFKENTKLKNSSNLTVIL